jgi:hypothetical protein
MNGQREVVNWILTILLCVIIQKNLKNREEYLSFIKFAYNRGVYSTTDHS